MSYDIHMKKIFLLLLLSFYAIPVYAKYQYPEKVYQAQWCNAHKGTMEYVIKKQNESVGRIDCLLPNMAVEVDYAKKWHECLGQALEYSARTKRTPACLLIVESEKDWKFVNRLRYTIQKKAPGTRTFTIQPSQIKPEYIPVNNKLSKPQ